MGIVLLVAAAAGLYAYDVVSIFRTSLPLGVVLSVLFVVLVVFAQRRARR